MPRGQYHKMNTVCLGFQRTCNAVVDAITNKTGYCKICWQRWYYHNHVRTPNTIGSNTRPNNGGWCVRSTEWFTDSLGIKTRYHGDV